MPKLELPLPVFGLMVFADVVMLFVGFFVHVALVFLAAFLVLLKFSSGLYQGDMEDQARLVFIGAVLFLILAVVTPIVI